MTADIRKVTLVILYAGGTSTFGDNNTYYSSLPNYVTYGWWVNGTYQAQVFGMGAASPERFRDTLIRQVPFLPLSRKHLPQPYRDYEAQPSNELHGLLERFNLHLVVTEIGEWRAIEKVELFERNLGFTEEDWRFSREHEGSVQKTPPPSRWPRVAVAWRSGLQTISGVWRKVA